MFASSPAACINIYIHVCMPIYIVCNLGSLIGCIHHVWLLVIYHMRTCVHVNIAIAT